MLYAWAKRRHHNKGKIWIVHKYWHKIRNRKWTFAIGKLILVSFSDTKIERYRIACLDKNPYLDREYFEEWRERRRNFFSSTQWSILCNFLADTWKGRDAPERSKGKLLRSVRWRGKMGNRFLLSYIRKTMNFSKTMKMHQKAFDLFQAWYNSIKPHKSLRLKIDSGNRKWFQRTPAMAEGITDHMESKGIINV